jgi:formylglycine-generating enzyme required for sulfatase activity
MEEAARLGVSVAREISLSEGVSLRFVLVPTGEFMMGSPESEKGRTTSEGPVHRVPITQAFFLGICEVSQEQYQAVMGKNPSRSQGAKKPVENVSWDDAWEFCKKLSEKQGEPVRLPTEAEWEYACRAGTTTPFNFGEWIWTDKANYDGDAYGDGRRGKWVGETVPVGSFPPNAWGLYDMHGNVREWCQSLYIPYPYRFDDGREEVRSARPRAVRGGAWSDSPKECRSAGRGPWRPRDPDEHDAYTGFRVLLEPQSPVP